MKRGRALVWAANRWERFGLPFLVAVLLLVFSLLSSPFRSSYSLMSNLSFSSLVGIGSIGMVFCIMSGDFDISIGSMSALAGVLGASMVTRIGSPAAMLLTVAIASFFGFVNGVFVTKLRIPAFITTLGMQFVYRALAYIYTSNTPVYIKDKLWLSIGSGNVLGIPFPILLTAICFAAAVYVLRKTPFGRYVIAVGTNRNAAMLSGINVDRNKMFIYGISGFLAAIAGILVMGRLQSGAYQNGTNMTLVSVAAVVIGGTSLAGGKGGIWGTLIGVFIIRIVEAGLVYLDVPSNAKEIVIGAIIILAVMLDVIRSGEITWLRRRPKTS